MRNFWMKLSLISIIIGLSIFCNFKYVDSQYFDSPTSFSPWLISGDNIEAIDPDWNLDMQNGDVIIDGGNLDLGFTKGSIPFDGDNGLTEDNSNLFWDDDNKILKVATDDATANYTIAHFDGNDIYGNNDVNIGAVGGDAAIWFGGNTANRFRAVGASMEFSSRVNATSDIQFRALNQIYFRDNDSTKLTIDLPTNKVGINETSPGASLHVQTVATTDVGAIIKGVASQSANLVEWRDSSNTLLASVDKDGNLGIGKNATQIIDVQDTVNGNVMMQLRNINTGSAAQTNIRTLNDAGKLAQLGIYGSNHSGYGSITASAGYLYVNDNTVIMADGTGHEIRFSAGGKTAQMILHPRSENIYGKLRIGTSSNIGVTTDDPSELNMGGTYYNSTPTSAKAKWKLYDAGTDIEVYGIGISTGQMDFFKFTGGKYAWHFSDVEEMSLSESNLTITNGGLLVPNGNVGIGTATPNSTLEVAGSIACTLTEVNVNTTLDGTHCTVVVDDNGGTKTITLPAASGVTNRIYTIISKYGNTFTITVDGNGAETINGDTTVDIYAEEILKIQTDGSEWFISS